MKKVYGPSVDLGMNLAVFTIRDKHGTSTTFSMQIDDWAITCEAVLRRDTEAPGEPSQDDLIADLGKCIERKQAVGIARVTSTILKRANLMVLTEPVEYGWEYDLGIGYTIEYQFLGPDLDPVPEDTYC